MQLQITELKDTEISGVRVVNFEDAPLISENYFEWYPFTMDTQFKSSAIMGGVLAGWHHTVNYTKCEIHDDAEVFYFNDGDCIMFFIDVEDGEPLMDTAQLVRIPEGTVLEMAAGKGHYVPVAEGDYYQALVFSPRQDAIKFPLAEEVTGVF